MVSNLNFIKYAAMSALLMTSGCWAAGRDAGLRVKYGDYVYYRGTVRVAYVIAPLNTKENASVGWIHVRILANLGATKNEIKVDGADVVPGGWAKWKCRGQDDSYCTLDGVNGALSNARTCSDALTTAVGHVQPSSDGGGIDWSDTTYMLDTITAYVKNADSAVLHYRGGTKSDPGSAWYSIGPQQAIVSFDQSAVWTGGLLGEKKITYFCLYDAGPL